MKDEKTGETVCPKCKRRYTWDFCLALLRETITSERKKRPHCDYCQKSAKKD